MGSFSFCSGRRGLIRAILSVFFMMPEGYEAASRALTGYHGVTFSRYVHMLDYALPRQVSDALNQLYDNRNRIDDRSRIYQPS